MYISIVTGNAPACQARRLHSAEKKACSHSGHTIHVPFPPYPPTYPQSLYLWGFYRRLYVEKCENGHKRGKSGARAGRERSPCDSLRSFTQRPFTDYEVGAFLQGDGASPCKSSQIAHKGADRLRRSVDGLSGTQKVLCALSFFRFAANYPRFCSVAYFSIAPSQRTRILPPFLTICSRVGFLPTRGNSHPAFLLCSSIRSLSATSAMNSPLVGLSFLP